MGYLVKYPDLVQIKAAPLMGQPLFENLMLVGVNQLDKSVGWRSLLTALAWHGMSCRETGEL